MPYKYVYEDNSDDKYDSGDELADLILGQPSGPERDPTYDGYGGEL